MTQEGYISLTEAGNELGVGRTTLYYYARMLAIETKKFPLDRLTYIRRSDLERIRAAKEAAANRQRKKQA